MTEELKSLPRSIPFTYYKETKKGEIEPVIVNIKKLPLGKSAQLGLALKKLPGKIQELRKDPEIAEFMKENEDLEVIELVRFLPQIIDVATDAVTEILALGTGLEHKVVESFGLDEATEALLAIVKVNNVKAILGNVKELGRLLLPNQPNQTQSGSKE